jgi:hypothetical protein
MPALGAGRPCELSVGEPSTRILEALTPADIRFESRAFAASITDSSCSARFSWRWRHQRAGRSVMLASDRAVAV